MLNFLWLCKSHLNYFIIVLDITISKQTPIALQILGDGYLDKNKLHIYICFKVKCIYTCRVA